MGRGRRGGSRGGFWSNARKAWEVAAIGRLTPDSHIFEVFYLDRDEVPESDTGTRLWGANYELALGDESTFGAAYLKLYADGEVKPDRDGLNVFNARVFTSHFGSLPGLSFELKYAREDNGDRLGSDAFSTLAGYEMSKVAWKPKLSYRYAYFEGDDPATATNEGFDSLLPGFYDWGTWWQGEIAGEYFVSNSNLISHQVRVHTTPSDSIGTGLIFFKFLADKAAAVGPEVTSRDVAFEMETWTGTSTRTSRSASWARSRTRASWCSKSTIGRRTSPTA